jgi:outer membrane protein assembly factor BamB
MTISPDGATIYAMTPDRVMVFRRQQSQTPRPAPPPPPPPPALTVQPVNGLGTTQAVLAGDVNPLASAASYHWDYGKTTSYGSHLPPSDRQVGSDSTFHEVVDRISGLTPGTTYHARLVATSPAGTSRGKDFTFTTASAPAPVPESAAAISEAGSGDRSTAYQINPGHSGALSGDALSGQLVERWALSLGDRVSYPVIADGKVFVTAVDLSVPATKLLAIDASSGALLWSYRIEFTTSPSPGTGVTYDNGMVFLTGAGLSGSNRLGGIAAFDANTGVMKWTSPSPVFVSAPPTASGGILYSPSDGFGGLVSATRESDGTRLWTASITTGDRASPAVGGGSVYVSPTGYTYSLGATDGKLLWSHGCDACSGGGPQTPVLAAGRLYIRDGHAARDYTLDPATGKELGDFASTPDEDQPPAVSGTTMLIVHGGTMTAHATDTQASPWTFTGDGELASAPIVVNGTAYVHSLSGRVYGVDLITGRMTWSADAGGPAEPQTDPYITAGLGAGNGLLVVPAGGRLVAYSNATQQVPPPAATTSAASGVARTTATIGGVVNPKGKAASYHFEWGPGTGSAYPNRTPASDQPAGSDSADHAFSANLTGLVASTTYHFRVVATNCGGCVSGTAYGADRTFTTSASPAPPPPPPKPPLSTTTDAGSVGADSATLNGTVDPQGQATTYHFEWGTSPSYGSATAGATASAGSGQQAVAATLGSLESGTTYHFRLVAESAGGTSFGLDRSFTTTLRTVTATPPSESGGSPWSDTPAPGLPSPPAETPEAPVSLAVGLSLPAYPLIGDVVAHGLPLRLSCTVQCMVRAELVLARAPHRKLGYARGTLHAATSGKLRVKIGRAGRRLLKRATRAPIIVRLAATGGGERVKLVRRVVAERGKTVGVRLPH